jgi:hypothetical protein
LRRVVALGAINLGIGAVGSVYALDTDLRPFYGGEAFPVAAMVFLRFWPIEMHMGHSSAGRHHAQ